MIALHHPSTYSSIIPIRFPQTSQKRLINIHCISLKHIFFFADDIGHNQIWYEHSVVFMIKDQVRQQYVCCGLLSEKFTFAVPLFKYQSMNNIITVSRKFFFCSYKEKIKSQWPAELHTQRPTWQAHSWYIVIMSLVVVALFISNYKV